MIFSSPFHQNKKRSPTFVRDRFSIYKIRIRLFPDIHLVEQIACTTELVDDEEHVA